MYRYTRSLRLRSSVVAVGLYIFRMVSSVTFKLNNGADMPALGLGTWKSKPGEVANAVKCAIDGGYRHIDCAYIYGNEKEIGEALKVKIDEGIIKREDIFLTSKLWNSKHDAADVRPSLEESLKNLQVTYLDLYLIHWPIGLQSGENNFPKDEAGNLLYSDTHYLETWRELEKCVGEGLVKAIGLSNFNSEQVKDVIENGRIKPAVNQVECHPYLNQKELINYCKERNVIVTAYSPLGSPDRPWAKTGEPLLMEDPKIINIAKKYNKTAAQVCIRFQIERGVVVIPKSITPQRIVQNADVFDFKLTVEDISVIESFNKPWRACIPTIVNGEGKTIPRDAHHKFFPFNIPY